MNANEENSLRYQFTVSILRLIMRPRGSSQNRDLACLQLFFSTVV